MFMVIKLLVAALVEYVALRTKVWMGFANDCFVNEIIPIKRPAKIEWYRVDTRVQIAVTVEKSTSD